MKILFVISTLGFGGAERVCSLLSSRFAKDFEVCIAKFDKSEPFYELNSDIKLVNLDFGVGEKGFLGNIKKRFGKIFLLRKFIKDEKFDCVISFMDSTNILVLMATRSLKIPIFVSEHTSFELVKDKIWDKLKRIFYPRANGLSVLTHDDYRYYKKFVKNVNVIYNPFFGEQKAVLQKQNLVLFAGRLIKLKGCDLFLKAIFKLDKKLIDSWEFAVAGSGESERELKNLAKELGIKVKFLGNVKNIDEIYKKSKILVSSSYVEGLGNTLIEAIYYECARISSKTSGGCELIRDEFDGLLFEVGNSNQLSQKLGTLMQSDEKITQITKNAKLKIAEFDIETIYQKWLNMLKNGGFE
ncbi:glycosyltransferase [Campylobacter geochelonis]|uniref:glycosyltransferase n=1 Tax=Campylobacter geochelonis TaxID=1780362 RepID=UPI0007707654|nr:glycosyltransferase [Campylobacter geochelonis]CZE47024.1 general glycosylation pathway protein [Campylobacter geochelonis]CZE50961.1 general glycosylation pathway protein [Campylobacter geochelonis]